MLCVAAAEGHGVALEIHLQVVAAARSQDRLAVNLDLLRRGWRHASKEEAQKEVLHRVTSTSRCWPANTARMTAFGVRSLNLPVRGLRFALPSIT